MNYKGFIIESQQIDDCVWHSSTESASIIGTKTVYRVKDSVSNLVFAMRQTLELAMKAIDKNGQRWLK